MIIVVSPTKTIKSKKLNIEKELPPFLDESKVLRKQLEAMSKDELKTLYKASDKIIDYNYEMYQKPQPSLAALDAYAGLVFKQLDYDNFTEDHYKYMSEHLRILSTLYGILKIDSEIHPYRLDYTMPFPQSLYAYWEAMLSDYLKDHDCIINLASQEYINSFKHHNIVNIHFVDENNRSLATASKMARGQMLNFMILNKIKTVDELKAFKRLDYVYDKILSDNHNYYFKKIG